MGGRAKVAVGALVVLAMVAAGALVAAEVDGRDSAESFGEAFSGEPCEFLTDREVQQEFGSAVAHDLESVVGRGFERAQDSRINLEGRQTCVVTFDDKAVTFSGSPSAIVTLTERDDAAELFARSLRNAQNGGFLSEGTVDVGDASFCTAPDTGGVGGVLARTGNRVTYVIFDRAEAGTTTESIVTDDSVSCREAARVARLVLN